MTTKKTTTVRKSAGGRPRAVRRKTKLPDAVVHAVHAAQSKKAFDVVVLDLRKTGGFTDYFVICTGASGRQIQAIAEAIIQALKESSGERPVLAEGFKRAEWILLDYFDFVVHVFSAECRAFYSLEKLWGDAERHTFTEPA